MTKRCAVGGADCPGHVSTALVCSGRPTSVLLGILVVHELNMLHQEPCCERCCAPCGVLADLLDSGRLRGVLADAPAHLTQTWDDLTDEWLRSRWSCQSNPPCNPEERS